MSDFYDYRIHGPKSFTPVNLSDTADVKLIDLTAKYIEDDMLRTNESLPQFPRGFHSNADGTFCFIPLGSPAPVAIVVVKGMPYPYGFRKARVTGSITIGNGDIIAWR